MMPWDEHIQEVEEEERDIVEEFTLKPEHLKLLQNAHVWWDDGEFGAPAIDCKRPYGNSNVTAHIAEILEWPTNDGELTEEQEDAAIALHKETQTALQIVLQFIGWDMPAPQLYVCDDRGQWDLP